MRQLQLHDADAGERLNALYEAGAFPAELNKAIEEDVDGLDGLLELWLELNPQNTCVNLTPVLAAEEATPDGKLPPRTELPPCVNLTQGTAEGDSVS